MTKKEECPGKAGLNGKPNLHEEGNSYGRETCCFTHRGDLEGIVSASVINIVSEAGHKQSKDLHVLQNRELVTLLVKGVAEVSH